MKFRFWYTKQFDGYEGAVFREDFKSLAEAWNYYNDYKEKHPDDRNVLLEAKDERTGKYFTV